MTPFSSPLKYRVALAVAFLAIAALLTSQPAPPPIRHSRSLTLEWSSTRHLNCSRLGGAAHHQANSGTHPEGDGRSAAFRAASEESDKNGIGISYGNSSAFRVGKACRGARLHDRGRLHSGSLPAPGLGPVGGLAAPRCDHGEHLL